MQRWDLNSTPGVYESPHLTPRPSYSILLFYFVFIKTHKTIIILPPHKYHRSLWYLRIKVIMPQIPAVIQRLFAPFNNAEFTKQMYLAYLANEIVRATFRLTKKQYIFLVVIIGIVLYLRDSCVSWKINLLIFILVVYLRLNLSLLS